jgi:cold shock CspA family protein
MHRPWEALSAHNGMDREKGPFAMAQGTIKKLVSDRGFGFIVPAGEQGRNDLFFHRNDVQGAGYDVLREGDQVSFDLGTDARRGTPKADNVRPA